MSVVDCLTVIFRYDSHGYMNRERFQLVTKPLIDQVGFYIYFVITYLDNPLLPFESSIPN